MQNFEKISVIVPVYNVKNFLEKFLNSLLSQSYKNLDIILVDDGSTDGSGEICEQYRKKDERLRVIHQVNQGVGAARNRGLLAAEGTSIAFADPDDELCPEMFEKLINIKMQNQCDIVCCTYLREVSGIYYKGQPESKFLLGPDAMAEMIKEDWYTTAVRNKLFDRNVIIEKTFPEDRKIGEDEYFLRSILCENKIRVMFCCEHLYVWKAREGSALSSERSAVSDKELDELKTKAETVRFFKEIRHRAGYMAAASKLAEKAFVMTIKAYELCDFQWANYGSGLFLKYCIFWFMKIRRPGKAIIYFGKICKFKIWSRRNAAK